jgi:uncharacterized protein (TIGR01777 family)
MKVAVTGGTGFLGRPLIGELIRQGHEVTVLARDPEAAKRSMGNVSVERFDAAAPGNAVSLAGQQAVVHLAGEPIGKRWTEEQKVRVIRSRTEGTSAIVSAAMEAKTVKVLLSGSAIGYYGPHGDEVLTEVSPPGNDFLARVCVAWEAATAPAREAGIRTVNVRTGIVLHPEGGALSRMLAPFRLGVGGRLGTGTQYMSWIDRSDWVSLCAHCLNSPVLQGPVNFTAPHPVTNREFTRGLGDALHRPTPFPAPAFALKLALGEMAVMLLEGQRVLPERALATGFRFRFPTLGEALGNLFANRAA